MKYYDYCYVAGMHGDPEILVLNDELKIQDKSLLVLTENPFESKSLNDQGVDCICVDDYAGSVFDVVRHLNSESFKHIKRKSLILTEKKYYPCFDCFLYYKAAKITLALEKISDSFGVGVFVQKAGGEILRRLVHYYSKKQFSSFCITYGESYLQGRSTLYKGEYKKPVDSCIESNLVSDGEWDKDEIVGYESCMDKGERNRLKILAYLLRQRAFNVIYSYFIYRLDVEFLGVIRKFACKILYSKKIPSNFFFYPLNVQAESELYVRNLFDADQYSNIKKILLCKPEGKKIVIKEHPGLSRSLSFFQLLKLRLRGVLILEPSFSGRKVIDKSEGVIGISSTVLFEAIIQDKPALVVGYWPYLDMAGLKKSASIEERLVDFFNFPESFVVNKKAFLEEVSKYLFRGSAFSSESEYREIVRSITKVKKNEV